MKIRLLFIAICVMFFSMLGLDAQTANAPNMGNATNFALYTVNGAITNTGSTNVLGDIGSPVGTISGFGTIDGTIYDQSSANYLSTVTTDVQNASKFLNNLTPTVTIPTSITMGTLTPLTLDSGVYSISGAVTIDTLVLDAQNNPNARFIFNINGALTTNPSSRILIINQAAALNIFFNTTGGAVVLHSNSVFVGTIIADGAISLDDGASLTGRAASLSGAIVSQNSVMKGASQAAELPITLLSFTATNQNGNALLNWETASETNSKSFTVEYSDAPNGTWKKNSVIAAAVNSNTVKNYSVLDNNVSKGYNYYRLRSTDIDGTFTLSNVAVVYFKDGTATTINAYPNPIVNNLTITGLTQNCNMELIDMSGKTLIVQTANNNGIDLMETSRLARGLYILKTTSAQGVTTTIKINKL